MAEEDISDCSCADAQRDTHLIDGAHPSLVLLQRLVAKERFHLIAATLLRVCPGRRGPCGRGRGKGSAKGVSGTRRRWRRVRWAGAGRIWAVASGLACASRA